MKEFLSVAELCNLLNLSKSTVYKMSCKGILPIYKPKGSKLIYFKYSDIINYLESGRIDSVDEIIEQTRMSLETFK
ncbi:helix-turn-helix domain-containing protein [Mucilaginibacter sp. JRF]|nr:helix-turn-helix domain-containing protein [Mucilaginibacter sp. JRF]